MPENEIPPATRVDIYCEFEVYRGVTLRDLFEKSSPRPLKNFWGKITTTSVQILLQRGLRVILALRAKARSA